MRQGVVTIDASDRLHGTYDADFDHIEFGWALRSISLLPALDEFHQLNRAPSVAALAPIGKGLEFVAVTHPSSVFTGQDARFVVLFDGKPVKGQAVTLNAGDDRYAETKTPPVTVVSDDQGRFAVKVERSGVYQIQARYRVPPAAEGQAGQSYTYALTFESLR